MGYILGIDQGGTKTYAAVMDRNGNMVSCHRTGGCYFQNNGIANAMEYIVDAIENALQDASITIDDVDIIVAGISGIDWADDETLVANALKERIGEKEIIACNDCEIAYYSGSLEPVGSVICAGTGLNVAFFAPDGTKFVLGEYVKSSLQGGSAIARKAFEAVAESDLGVLPETKLTKLFLDFSNDKSVYDLLWRMMMTERFATDIISLVPDIIEIADNGDPVAQGVLTEFADGLCRLFVAAMKKKGMLDLACDIVIAGSVFKGRVNGLTAMMEQGILQHATKAHIVNAQFEPIVGACILGLLKKAGSFDKLMLHNVSVSAEKVGLLRLLPA